MDKLEICKRKTLQTLQAHERILDLEGIRRSARVTVHILKPLVE